MRYFQIFFCDFFENKAKKIISNPDFAVMQIEMDLYHLLASWLFLQLNTSYEIKDPFEEVTFNIEQE